jgi:hypothetical protein
MRFEAGVGDLVWRIRDDQVHVGYSVAGRSRDWVTLSAICIVHMEEVKSTGFPVYPQNRW